MFFHDPLTSGRIIFAGLFVLRELCFFMIAWLQDGSFSRDFHLTRTMFFHDLLTSGQIIFVGLSSYTNYVLSWSPDFRTDHFRGTFVLRELSIICELPDVPLALLCQEETPFRTHHPWCRWPRPSYGFLLGYFDFAVFCTFFVQEINGKFNLVV
jgi:hypothetical protein